MDVEGPSVCPKPYTERVYDLPCLSSGSYGYIGNIKKWSDPGGPFDRSEIPESHGLKDLLSIQCRGTERESYRQETVG